MACNNNCGGNQTGIFAKCPDGTLPLYKFELYDLSVSNQAPVKVIGPYNHATALLELHKFLNPPIQKVQPIQYEAVQVQLCGNEEISRTSNFPITCGPGNPGTECLPPPTCGPIQWNAQDCYCCPPGSVYCAETGQCVPLPEGCQGIQWNPNTCQCCPPGYVYCPLTGECELPENCGGGGTGCPPGYVYCDATGECVEQDDCPTYQYNQSICECCPPSSVYCIATQDCIPIIGLPCLVTQWNQLTCECCPPGYVYCSQTGECLPLPPNCTPLFWNPITCACCPAGYVFCVATGECVVFPEDCTIQAYNPNTCECCLEGQVFCATTQTCIPLPQNCPLPRWNPLTCECCPVNSIFNGVSCQTICDPSSYAPVSLNWALLTTGGGIQINSVLGAGGQQATAFTLIITPASGQGIGNTTIQYPVPANPNDPPVTFPISIPLPSGNYTFTLYGIQFGDCVLSETVSGEINGVTGIDCCSTIVGIGGGNEVRYFDAEITVPNQDGPYLSFIDLTTYVMVDRVSAYLDDGSGFKEIAQSPFIGIVAFPVNEYPGLAFATGVERGYWRNANANAGSLAAPYRYAPLSGNPAGINYPNSDYGFSGSNNYLAPANRAEHDLPSPPNWQLAGSTVGRARLFFYLPDTVIPGDTVTVRFRIEGGLNGTVWRAIPGCVINELCENCGQQLPVPDECCPFKVTKTITGLLNGNAGTAVSITLPDDLVPINGATPYNVVVTFSPGANAGLSYNPATKVISGILQPGPLNILLQITDANGCTVTQIVNKIVACPEITIALPNPLLPFDLNGAFEQLNLSATGGFGTHTWSLVTGSLPPGINMATLPGDSTILVLSGIAQLPPGGCPPSNPCASYPVVIKVTDANGCTSQIAFVLTTSI